MFIGHYAAAFLVKKFEPKIPLWTLFLAAQFVDLIWDLFIFLGIEKMRVVPGFTASNPFDLYYMPYTHSLVAGFLWAVSVFFLSNLYFKDRRASLFLSLAVLSHWFFDLPVHAPDLPIFADNWKQGFRLWDYYWLELAVETLLIFGTAYFYISSREDITKKVRTKLYSFTGILVVLQIISHLIPPPPTDTELVISAFASYCLLTIGAFFAEKE